MMTCSNCGGVNVDGARFCNKCGTLLIHSQKNASAAAFEAFSNAIAKHEAPESDPLIGRIIDGRYELTNQLGTGGMGAVYRATRLLIGDEVAIKILHQDHVTKDPLTAERFRREAQAAARLKHPNAVSIYDFGVSSDGLQYLVMELIEGKSLRAITKQRGALDVSLAAEVTSQVCAALDEAHRQHIVHRDIKPDNIMLNFSAGGLRVKVLDFGIAKLRDDTASHLTQTGSVVGTPHYMSPEQCLGEELDNRADIYSVGVVLYEMLCGRVPFNSPISTAVVVQHVNQPPPPLRTINPSISSQMEAAVLHALEKRREARPQTATALQREITAAATGAGFDYQNRQVDNVGEPINEGSDDERTIENRRLRPTPISTTSSTEMAPTVHLASLSDSTGQVGTGRDTAGSGVLDIARLKRALAHKYFIVALPLSVLLVLAGFISWRVFLIPETSTNSSDKPQLDNASGVPDNANRKKTREAPVPSQGMAVVRGGSFMMGSNDEDQDSRPPHAVTVNPFFIDIYEVTCEDYKKFLEATGHTPPKEWINGSYPPGAARHPVTGVSWEDADKYAGWAGKRLPSEEEWEFAARGQNGLKYPWGNSWKPGCANADIEGLARKAMADVGSHNCESPSGTMDMIGNAWEWTASDWGPYPGGRLQYRSEGSEKVIRGGSWETPKGVATSVYRSGLVRSGDKTGYDKTGFRCAKDAQP